MKFPDSSLRGQACAGSFGASFAEITPSAKSRLYDLSRPHDIFAGRPELLALSIDYDAPIDPLPVGIILLRADLLWHTGKGTQSATIDVPASGTVAVMVGADGLQVDVQREGTSNAAIVRVRSTLAVASATGGRAQRTLSTGPLPRVPPLLPRQPIPRFARTVRMLVDTGTLAGNFINFYPDRGSPVIATVDAPESFDAPIPNGARFWDVTLVPFAGRNVRTIWGLSL